MKIISTQNVVIKGLDNNNTDDINPECCNKKPNNNKKDYINQECCDKGSYIIIIERSNQK